VMSSTADGRTDSGIFGCSSFTSTFSAIPYCVRFSSNAGSPVNSSDRMSLNEKTSLAGR
jgi:hypothetical protein